MPSHPLRTTPPSNSWFTTFRHRITSYNVCYTKLLRYIFIGVRFEEHDLEKALPEYGAYKKAVPMFMPGRMRDLKA